MSSPFDPDALAQAIKSAQDHGHALQPFTAHHAAFDLPSAYDVAHRVHRLRLGEGAQPVGRKIGFTNPDLWDRYGVREPVWATVYSHSVSTGLGTHHRCRIGHFAAPKIEPEIVVHFHSAPPPGADATQLLACIDWVAHGIEIVQSRFPDWRFQAADTVADQALHAALLIGDPCPLSDLGADPNATLQDLSVELFCNGTLRDQGRGRNVLGGPLLAIAHLLQVLARQPFATPLQAGEWVTTGTLTQALSISAGEVWHTAFEGIALPGLSIEFAST